MTKKKYYLLPAGILTACLCCASLGVSAYTPDEVAAKAREAGWPENIIQIGYNQWASGEYTQEQLDEAYDSVLDYNEQTEEFVYNSFGIDPDEARAKIAEKETAETSVPTEAETQPETSAPETTENPSESQTAPETTEQTAPETTVPPETQPEKYIPDSEFISMTLEQKQEYVNSLDTDDKTDFIAGLSTEARNSIIKQLPTDEKIAIMQKYIDTATTMGMNITVDEITDKDISLTVRNQEGVVVDKAEVGIVIDETGISYTKPLLAAGIGILISAAGFGWLYWYIQHTEHDNP